MEGAEQMHIFGASRNLRADKRNEERLKPGDKDSILVSENIVLHEAVAAYKCFDFGVLSSENNVLKRPGQRPARDRLETERPARDRLETKRLARDRLETKRPARDRLETERPARDRLETERLARDRLETERLARDRLETKRLARDWLETG
ncbi:hypothetical protein EYF80_057289 [Liparis tanakae]|uniref:Uncharacterized protein n=1 Tax=Liparis tanakae TaxID=230148 RepID=A0A4Z2EV74_9TELE|nr:hypothetical protein EYF80_057289 [Liparis tanakae]